MASAANYEPVEKKFEYLDHTADVQLHGWGDTLEEAFEQTAMAMFNYMTHIDDVLPVRTVEVKAQGEHMESLLFNFLDEFLFLSSIDNFFMARQVKIVNFDREKMEITALGYGEDFDKSRHGGKGTEVKAITYSAMKISERADKNEIFVIVDI